MIDIINHIFFNVEISDGTPFITGTVPSYADNETNEIFNEVQVITGTSQ